MKLRVNAFSQNQIVDRKSIASGASTSLTSSWTASTDGSL